MAKRVTKKIQGVQKANQKPIALKSFTTIKGLKKLIAAPATMYVAGGLGVALLARFAYRYYNSHPEISDYISENFENVEEKLKEYRDNLLSRVDRDMSEDAH